MKAEKNSGSAQSGKIMTKYDRKMQARRLEEERDKRNAKIAKAVFAAVVALVVVAAVYLAAGSVIKKNQALNDTYIKVGEHNITKLEYDFYYNNYMNQFLNMYSSILPYMGLDTSADLSKQQYTDGMTWKDMFDQSAVNMITSTKSLYDDAMANGFEYDTTESYNEYTASLKEGAESAGVPLSQYYKAMYGTYATADNVKPFVLESLISENYYNKLLEDNKPSDEEVKAYYEINKNAYDQASFYNFPVSASTDETTGAVLVSYEQAVETAKAMAKRAGNGEDFETLCLEYATDSMKSSYEPEDSEFSLTTGRTYSSINSAYADWIYDDTRKEGDVEVFEDSANQTCYVVKFVSVVYDENCPETISNTLASRAVEEYAAALTDKYEVTDVKGEMTYLNVPETESSSEDVTSAGTETQTEQ